MSSRLQIVVVNVWTRLSQDLQIKRLKHLVFSILCQFLQILTADDIVLKNCGIDCTNFPPSLPLWVALGSGWSNILITFRHRFEVSPTVPAQDRALYFILYTVWNKFRFNPFLSYFCNAAITIFLKKNCASDTLSKRKLTQINTASSRVFPLITCFRADFSIFVYEKSAIQCWLSFPFCKQEETKHWFITRPKLKWIAAAAHQSLLNGQKSFPSLVLFRSFLSLFMFVCTNCKWKRKQVQFFCFLPKLWLFLSSFLLFFSGFSFLICLFLFFF